MIHEKETTNYAHFQIFPQVKKAEEVQSNCGDEVLSDSKSR